MLNKNMDQIIFNGKNINDWKDLNEIRSRPNFDLVKSRFLPNTKDKVLKIWSNLSMDSVPCLLIETTNICRVNCQNCAKAKSEPNVFEMLSLSILLHNLKNKNLNSVWLTGGEPIHDLNRLLSIIKITLSNKLL